MQLTQLQTLVNYRRREGNESFVNNDEIKAYLNEGLRDVFRSYDGEFSRNYATFPYVSGTTVYAISAIAPDYKAPIDLTYTYNYQLQLVTPEDFVRLSAGSNDIWSIKDADSFMCYTTFGSANLGLNYYSGYMAKTSGGSKIQELSASTDEPLLPYRYQDMLVDYAASRCYQKEGLVDDFQIAYSAYKDKLTSLLGEMSSYRSKPLKRIKHINETGMNPQPFDKSNPLNQ